MPNYSSELAPRCPSSLLNYSNDSNSHALWIIEQWKTSFYAVFGVIIAISNTFTVIAVCKFKYLHTPTFVFVFSLSVADLLLFPPLAGLRFICHIQDDATVVALNVILLTMMCLSLNMSLMSLLAIAVDRYKAVTIPYTYKSTMTVQRARRAVLVMWLYGIVTMVPTVVYFTLQKSPEFLRKTQEIPKIIPKPWFIVLVAVQSALYILISTLLYIRIFVKLRKRAEKSAALRGYTNEAARKTALSSEAKRTTNLMAMVLGTIVFTWLPFNIVAVACVNKDNQVSSHILYTLTLMILYANSFLNPVIYVWRSSLFRRAYLHLLTCGKVATKELHYTNSQHELSSS